MNITLGYIKLIDITSQTARIRIPSIHGPNKLTDYPPYVKGTKRELLWTLDKDLPDAKIMFPLGTDLESLQWSNEEIISGESTLLKKDEVVYVLLPETSGYSDPIIVGTTGSFYKE